AGIRMVSGAASAFAAIIASRSEQSASQAPSAVSAVLVTVKVAAWAFARSAARKTRKNGGQDRPLIAPPRLSAFPNAVGPAIRYDACSARSGRSGETA